MIRIIAVLAALAIAGAVVIASASSASKDGRQLYGSVGPGFVISLHEDGPDGAVVTSLRPGVYWLTVHDASPFHNFHIFGPGLDEVVTSVPLVDDVTVKIKVKHGDYTYQCDPHARTMKGTFAVGGAGQVDD